MKLVPITREQALAFLRAHHRHHGVVTGFKFAVGVIDDEVVPYDGLVGVATSGRPVSRITQSRNPYLLEVTRLCTNGAPNACSMLYGASRRAAIALGFTAGQTFILESESGTSLKASGWRFLGWTAGGEWGRPSRSRATVQPGRKQRWGWGAL